MAVFFSGQRVGTWNGQPMYATLYGEVNRSGNTVTLYNLSCTFTAAAAWGSDSGFNTSIYSGDNWTTGAAGLSMSGGSGSQSYGNSVISVGTGDTSHTYNFRSSEGYTVWFTVGFPSGGTGPSGGSVTYNSCTWNSVNITSSVSSWGSGYSGTPNLEQIVVQSSATPSTWTTVGRIIKRNATSNTTSTQSVTNANADLVFDGGITVKGCTAFKVAMWANTDVGYTNDFSDTVHYTPPAPPSATVVDDGYTYTHRKTKLTLTGANSTNNNSVNAEFQYRYKKASESTYSGWTSMGTGTVTGSETTTINLEGNTAYNIQFRQQYQGQNSEIVLKNYTTPAVPIQVALYGSVNGQTKRVTKLYGSVNGQTKEIKKLYGSVNDQTKLIYTG